MNVVLLCGGKGKRLWPLSNEVCPKQFISYIKYNDKYISMLQRTYKLVSKNKHKISIIIPPEYKKIVLEQIVNADIIIEPEQRNTFPAVMLGIVDAIYKKNLNNNSLIAFLPIDAYTDEDFYDILNIVEIEMSKQNYNIGLVGIKATIPSSNYGYIINKKGIVEKFIEKPTMEESNILIKNNALYNSGIFIVRIGYIKHLLDKYIQFKNYEEFIKKYSELPQTSFDYEILEKEKDILCVETSKKWMDIGNYNNFEKILEPKEFGNVQNCNSLNSTIINELDIPLKIIEADDLFVIANKSGILIKKINKNNY